MIEIFNNIYSYFADIFNNIYEYVQSSTLLCVVLILIHIGVVIVFGVMGYSKIADLEKNFHSIIKLIIVIICPMLFPLFEKLYGFFTYDYIYPTMPRFIAVALVSSIIILNCKTIGILHGLIMSYFLFSIGFEIARLILDTEPIYLFLIALGIVVVGGYLIFGGVAAHPDKKTETTKMNYGNDFNIKKATPAPKYCMD